MATSLSLRRDYQWFWLSELLQLRDEPQVPISAEGGDVSRPLEAYAEVLRRLGDELPTGGMSSTTTSLLRARKERRRSASGPRQTRTQARDRPVTERRSRGAVRGLPLGSRGDDTRSLNCSSRAPTGERSPRTGNDVVEQRYRPGSRLLALGHLRGVGPVRKRTDPGSLRSRAPKLKSRMVKRPRLPEYILVVMSPLSVDATGRTWERASGVQAYLAFTDDTVRCRRPQSGLRW